MSVKEVKAKWVETSSHMIVTLDGGRALPITIQKRTYKFRKVKKLIKEENIAKLTNYLFPGKYILKYSEGNFKLTEGGNLFIGKSKDPVPHVISERIIKFYNEGFPYQPLINFWNNIKKNPSENSKQQLYTFLEYNRHPITTDGCFLAYKNVNFKTNKEGKKNKKKLIDGHTQTIDNSVGQDVSMPRKDVVENPNETCDKGLHVASYSYGYGGDISILVKVNPRDVVSVPNEHGNGKMRVCRYKVLRTKPKELKILWVNPKGHVDKEVKKYMTNKRKKELRAQKKAAQKNTGIKISLNDRTAKQIISLVQEAANITLDVKPKNKKRVIRLATEALQKSGFVIT